MCDNCDSKAKTRPIRKGIWNYGVRTEQILNLCHKCEDF
jgi:hypothetical protein